jgi:hypothetical protein
MRIRDGDSSDPGSGMEKSRIRDKHPGSAILDANPGAMEAHPGAVETRNGGL